MTRPSWLGRAVRNRHRHAIEQAARRWRGGRRDDSARTRRKILISTQVKLDNGKLLSLKPANLEVQRKPKLEDRIKESQQRALRRAEERRELVLVRRDLAVARAQRDAETCVEIKILRRVRAESSRRPPRHRRDTCSMAWRCRFRTARPSQEAASSPRNDLVKNCRVHAARWLISAQVTTSSAKSPR